MGFVTTEQLAFHASHVLEVPEPSLFCMGGMLSPDVKFSAHYVQITPKTSACLAAERCGDVVTAYLTVMMVPGVCTLRGLPGDFRFNAEEVCRKLRIHNNMVFLFDTLPCRPTPK